MTLVRRWFDPISSQLFLKFYQKSMGYRCETYPFDGHVFDVSKPLVLLLSLDDPYSYLISQLLEDIYDNLMDLKTFQIVIINPNLLSNNQSKKSSQNKLNKKWLKHALLDASLIAKQHRLSFPKIPNIDSNTFKTRIPTTESCNKAHQLLKDSFDANEKNLHFLAQIYQILWHKQDVKLNTLLALPNKAIEFKSTEDFSLKQALKQPLKQPFMAGFYYQSHRFDGFDGCRHLVNQLKVDKKMTMQAPLFIDHIHWQDDLLINDPVELGEVQALKPELELFVLLEDPKTWLILDYLMRGFVDHYKIKLKLRIMSYQGKDDFIWREIKQQANHMNVTFAPFCRPDQDNAHILAQFAYAYKKRQRNEVLHALLKATWCHALDASNTHHVKKVLKKATKSKSAKHHNNSNSSSTKNSSTKNSSTKNDSAKNHINKHNIKPAEQSSVLKKCQKNAKLYDTLDFLCAPAMRLTFAQNDTSNKSKTAQRNKTHLLCGLSSVWKIQVFLAEASNSQLKNEV